MAQGVQAGAEAMGVPALSLQAPPSPGRGGGPPLGASATDPAAPPASLLTRCVHRLFAEGDELKQAVMLQIEYYLSRENLARDTFLVNQMNAQAYAPIALIAGFSKMKSFTTDMSVIMEAIKLSTKLEVDEAGTLVRPIDYEMPELKKKTTIVLREVPADVPEEQIRALFDEATFGPIAKVKSDVGGYWFIDMENEVSSDLLDKIREKQINGVYVKARLKTVSSAQTMFGASPTASASPEGSPTAMSAAQAQAAQYAYYPGYNPAYAGYAPQMYYNPQAAGRGAAPGSWGYMAWDPSMHGAVAAGQPAAYPAQGRGAGFAAAAGRGRGGAGVGAGRGGVARGGSGAGAGRGRGKGGAGAAPATSGAAAGAGSGNGSSASSKSAAKKKPGAGKASAPKTADDVRPEALSLGSAMDFPSLPGTPTGGATKKSEPDDPPAISKPEGVDSSIEAGEPVPAPAPAAAGGWAQVAKKGTPRAAGETPAVKAPPVVAETAASESKESAGSGRPEGGDSTASKAAPAAATAAAAAAPAPAPAPAAEESAPVQAPTVEPASSSGPKSWAQMAGLRASDPVKQAPVVKQPKASEASSSVRSSLLVLLMCLNIHSTHNATLRPVVLPVRY